MAFSSLTFLFLFLPLLLAAHRACPPGRGRTRLLFGAGLVFYAWGDLGHLPHLLAVLLFNHAALRALQSRRDRGLPAQPWLGLALAADLAYLCWYKYAGLASATAAGLAAWAGWGAWPVLQVALPLGISFYLFHAMSALIDVSRGTCDAPPTLLDTGMYITFFPQHIAGPIVRYKQLAPGLEGRPVSPEDMAEGLRRFCQGLAKKVLLADFFGSGVDLAWAQVPAGVGAPVAWAAFLVYPLQIYFDFSGYSDMAIGLGRIFGFHFNENFRHPFHARTMIEFWRRWHISFTTWVMDYLYTPLSRWSRRRAYRLFILVLVFLLSGLWHGAAWSFAVWALVNGVFLLMEHNGLERLLLRWPAWLGRAWVYLAASTACLFFRSPSVAAAWSFVRALFCGGLGGLALFRGQSPALWCLSLLAAALVCGPGPDQALQRWSQAEGSPGRALAAGALWPLLLLLLSLATLGSGTYHPFIYYRF
jgi:alginate O-acetyltransferase complex protein AlgI